MVDRAPRPAPLNGHVQNREHQLDAQVRSHRLPQDPSAEGVHHDRQVQKTGLRRHVRDVGDPELVGPVGTEVARDPIRSLGLAARRSRPLATACAMETGSFHEASDALFFRRVRPGPTVRHERGARRRVNVFLAWLISG
jgi:hypothetical protein